ncbi:unnamed protein product [Adineta ricciae]|uniref:ATP-grasp domain-containing protein n=1 Tax=Adineta ricciae TaxID=249248 RepID=A0A815RXH7_ADIRI|nr:unnamed protein product [Adineta ricciae]CAF1484257.1 unnamed protein product [Adineta ricciae]
MASRRVLILDDCQIESIIEEYSWSDLIDDDDDIELYILTSTGALSEKDKSCPRVRAYKEIDHPTTDGTLELWSYEMHKKHSFTHVYTKNEDLIMRVAHVRSLLNIQTGLTSETIAAYREKVEMKQTASRGGFPVPPFARLYAPADLIAFIEKQGYPVVVKPTLGCATSGLTLIKTPAELEKFLSEKLFTCIDIDQRMDLVGELMVEGYMKGHMFHVDGIAKDGKIIHAWPFSYLHTCLGFSQEGTAYGNSSIPKSHPLHDRLCKTAQRLLDILPSPNDGLVFHLELYENLNENRLPDDDFVLCEIAARAPGASITHLIDLLSFSDGDSKQSFARLDFRISVSLPIPKITEPLADKVVTDLIIPRKPGKLMYIPRECPIHDLRYIPIANVDKPTVYEKYDVNGMNAACRFIARTKTMEEGQELVEKGFEWFDSVLINTPLDEPCTVALIKELHRYFHRKIFA